MATGPIVMTRSFVYERPVLTNVPVEFAATVANFQVGVALAPSEATNVISSVNVLNSGHCGFLVVALPSRATKILSKMNCLILRSLSIIIPFWKFAQEG